MNKQTRLIFSALFVLIILLAIAITRSYSDTTQSTGSSNTQTIINEEIETDLSGNTIFRDVNGLYGIADANSRIIVVPEWLELKFADNNICIAMAGIGGRNLTGCIDYEGNIITPFIYQSISRSESDGYVFYTARSAGDGSYVIYDGRFVSLFPKSWDKCVFKDNELSLTDNIGTFTYSVNENGLTLKQAELYGEALGHEYILNIYSRVLLSKLSIFMLEDIVSDVGKYLEFAYTGNDELLSDITTGSRSGFLQLFPDDHKILSKKLMDISEIYIYSAKTEDEIPHYNVSVKADTEIVYSDEYFGTNTIYDAYKAVIEFSGSTGNDLMAVSGSFTQSEPDYPVPEPETESPEIYDDYGSEQTYIADDNYQEEQSYQPPPPPEERHHKPE